MNFQSKLSLRVYNTSRLSRKYILHNKEEGGRGGGGHGGHTSVVKKKQTIFSYKKITISSFIKIQI